MSYILSALKRAEQQRGRHPNEALTLMPASAGHTDPERSGSLSVLWWGLGAAVATLVGFGFFYGAGSDSKSLTVDRSVLPMAESAIMHPLPDSPAPPAAVNPPPAPAASSTAPPPLNITGYIFIENNPDNSRLFIDGIVYRRGSSPAPGVTLLEFNADAVVIAYRGNRHRIAVD